MTIRDEEEEEIIDESQFTDWEHNQELVRKLLSGLKALTIHEALLTLVAACDVLAKNSPADWDSTKVKKVLDNI